MNLRKSARRGFTLIELLVVIAIIAILAAILFPVFAQARDKARSIVCLSNSKQIGMSLMMYVQDFDETFPTAWGEFGSNHYVAELQPYIKNGYGNPARNADGSVAVLASATGAWQCPNSSTIGNNKVSVALTTNANLLGVGYGWGAIAPEHRALSLSAINRPAEVIAIAETNRVMFGDGNADTGTDFVRVGADVNGSRDCSDAQRACRWYSLQGKCYDYTNYEKTLKDPNIVGWRGKQLAYRHARNGFKTGNANIVFADGHAKVAVYGSVTPRYWLPELGDDAAAVADAYQRNLVCPTGLTETSIIPNN
jgi:prepilin-type N-terminal cleavage/methylation domain-containing protein/prepilin-type processing-associated H-X9-DG protein